MAIKSIMMPFSANKRGGLQLIGGSEAINQIVTLSVSPSANTNAFNQGLGVGYDLVFETPGAQIKAKDRIERILTRLEMQDIAKLDQYEDSIFYTHVGAGELTINIKYIDLENREKESTSTIKVA